MNGSIDPVIPNNIKFNRVKVDIDMDTFREYSMNMINIHRVYCCVLHFVLSGFHLTTSVSDAEYIHEFLKLSRACAVGNHLTYII